MASLLPLILSLSIFLLEVDGRNQNPPEMKHIMDNYFDCVDIHKQLAFQHPLLKNHIIQLYPTFTKQTSSESKSSYSDNVKVHNLTEGCPLGKVPIPYNMEMKQKKINIPSESPAEDLRPFSKDYPSYHFATVETTKNATYHGAIASISGYNLSLQMGQYSLSQTWIQSGPPSGLNSIQVGIGINPSLYGDSQLRLTGYWTIDNFQRTECFNILCPRFVQVDTERTFGKPFVPVVGTDEKYSLFIKINKINQRVIGG